MPTTKSGINVNEKNALKYLTVFSCVSLISADVARLPLILYRRYPDGSKKRMISHPLYDLLHTAPNGEMTSYNWRESAQGHLLLWGNHYSFKVKSKIEDRIAAIVPFENPGEFQTKKENGRIVYRWTEADGKKRVATRDDIFHVPGFGFDGLQGQSMITIAREAIGLGMASEEFSSRFYGQGTHIAGTLEMDTWVGPEKRKDVEEYIKRGFAGLGKSHSVFLAEGGMKYRPLTMPLKDAQHIEGRDYQKLEICGMYHVPPHKIARHGSNSNYNNLEQENASYVDSCLMHWIVRWEQCISQQLLTEKERKQGLFVEFLVDGLLRGDSQARGEFYTKLFQVGGLSPNDIRSKENMDPVPGGDQRFVQLNMIPLDMAAEVVKQQQKANEPKPEPAEPDDEQKSIRREKRSITARDRIAKQYEPLIKRAAKRIVSLEANAIKRQTEKQRKLRADGSIIEWLEEFYRGLDAKIRDEFGPVFRSFAQAIVDEATDELGVDFSQKDFDKFIGNFLDTYAARHIGSSLGQLIQIARDGGIEEIDKRVDEWSEKRADKIVMNEIVRLANSMYQEVSFSSGLSVTWRIRGSHTCQYCKALNGKTVSRGGQILNAGDVLYAGPDGKADIYNPDDPDSTRPKGKGEEGWSAFKVRGKVTHPPLHRGCFPGYTNISAIGIAASSERWFDGNLVVVHTAAGDKITCTPNHPILSRHGWIAAGELQEGFKVARGFDGDRDSAIVRNCKNVESRIEDIAKSFVDLVDMVAVPVPTSAEDFDGDAINGEIAIIRADGGLLRKRDPELFEKLRKFNLLLRDGRQSAFSSGSGFAEFIKSHNQIDGCCMGCLDLLFSLIGRHALPNKFDSLAASPWSKTYPDEVVGDDLSGNSDALRHTENGFSGFIGFSDVVKVERDFSWHGFVYNLHTKSNRFVAENTIVHNCDCYISAL